MAGARTVTYSKPFPLPSYLRHSSYAGSFFTTPGAESPFEAIGAGTAEGGSLSEGLGTGIGEGAKAIILLPTCWDEDDRCSLIELGSDGLEASFAGALFVLCVGCSKELTRSWQAPRKTATETQRPSARTDLSLRKLPSTTSRSPLSIKATLATSVRFLLPFAVEPH